MKKFYCPVLVEDLDKAIAVFSGKMPLYTPVNLIRGNAFGDFIIENDTDTYIIKHTDWTLWKKEGDWKTGKWVEVS